MNLYVLIFCIFFSEILFAPVEPLSRFDSTAKVFSKGGVDAKTEISAGQKDALIDASEDNNASKNLLAVDNASKPQTTNTTSVQTNSVWSFPSFLKSDKAAKADPLTEENIIKNNPNDANRVQTYQDITQANIDMNSTERNVVAYGTVSSTFVGSTEGTLLSASGRTKIYTYQDVSVEVDMITGKIVSSTAKNSRFEKPLTESNINAKNKGRFADYEKIATQNPGLQPEEMQAIGFGKQAQDKNGDIVYSYNKIQVRVHKSIDGDLSVVDSNEPTSAYAAKKVNVNQFAGGKLTKSKVITPDGKIARDQVYSDDVYRAITDFNSQMIKLFKSSDQVVQNSTKTVTMFDGNATDINAQKKRAMNFGQNSRDTAKTMIRQTRLLAKQPDVFCKKLIKEQFNNVFGKDAGSFQKLISPKDMDALIQSIKESPQFKELTSGKNSITGNILTPTEQLDRTAKLTDLVMNKLSGGIDGIGQLETGFDKEGNFSSRMTSKASDGTICSSFSKTANDGTPITRSLTMGDVTYTTDFQKSWFSTKENSRITNETTGRVEDLTSYAESLSNSAWLLYQADRAFKFSAKVVLIGVKQAGINIATSLVSATISAQAAVLYVALTPMLLLPEVGLDTEGNLVIASKGQQVKTLTGMHLMGNGDFSSFSAAKQSFKDYTAASLALFFKLLNVCVGDNGEMLGGLVSGGTAMLSSSSGRLFRQGSWPSDYLNAMQGKTPKQVEDFNEGYVDTLAPFVTGFDTLVAGTLGKAFPQSFGKTILSNKELSGVQLTPTWSDTIANGLDAVKSAFISSPAASTDAGVITGTDTSSISTLLPQSDSATGSKGPFNPNVTVPTAKITTEPFVPDLEL